jgi:hypothetical protein
LAEVDTCATGTVVVVIITTPTTSYILVFLVHCVQGIHEHLEDLDFSFSAVLRGILRPRRVRVNLTIVVLSITRTPLVNCYPTF